VGCSHLCREVRLIDAKRLLRKVGLRDEDTSKIGSGRDHIELHVDVPQAPSGRANIRACPDTKTFALAGRHTHCSESIVREMVGSRSTTNNQIDGDIPTPRR